jgi:drug/metabolite transporter (DMT)-like permease
MKLLGDRLSFVEISFFRFFFSLITISIPILLSKKSLLKTNFHLMHITRGVVGSIAIAMCCLGIQHIPLAENTTIEFTEVLFTIPFAALILKEKVSKKTILSGITGFIGLIVIFKPNAANINVYAAFPVFAAILFALMNIMIKTMVSHKEHDLTMLFYFAFYSTIVASIFLPFFWQVPTTMEVLYFVVLGIGANLVQYFIFLSYKYIDASKVAPIRYTEILITGGLAYILFGQTLDKSDIIGGLFIIIGSFITSCSSTSKNEGHCHH